MKLLLITLLSTVSISVLAQSVKGEGIIIRRCNDLK